jgi:hypothetical protein
MSFAMSQTGQKMPKRAMAGIQVKSHVGGGDRVAVLLEDQRDVGDEEAGGRQEVIDGQADGLARLHCQVF